MKAAVSERYGPPEVVEIRDVAKPAPGPGDVLVRVRATTVSRTDCGMRRGHPLFIRLMTGLLRPKATILGMDFAGDVEAVGPEVTAFKPGDRVFGLSPDHYGAHAEFLCLAGDGPITTMPAGLSCREAVLCEGAWYSNTYFENFGLGPGHSILIYGASGAIGTAAVQLAKARGALVAAVVGTRHLHLAARLGADRVVNYEQEDFTALGETFDLVLDAVGHTSWAECRSLLKEGGVFAATDLGPVWSNIFLSAWFGMTGSRRVRIPFPADAPGFVRCLAGLMEDGRFTGVVDRGYPLDEIVEAFRYVETGRKTGIVVLNIA